MAGSLDRTFGALADPARLAAVKLLRRGPLRSSEMAGALLLPRPTMSRHLEVLRKAGLVEAVALEEDARARMYRLRRDRFAELRGFADEIESYWRDQLHAFKAHVERRRGRP